MSCDYHRAEKHIQITGIVGNNVKHYDPPLKRKIFGTTRITWTDKYSVIANDKVYRTYEIL